MGESTPPEEERLDRHGLGSVATRTAVRAECQRRGWLTGGGNRTMRAARGPAESARTISEWRHWHDVVIEKQLAPGWRTIVRGVTGPFMPGQGLAPASSRASWNGVKRNGGARCGMPTRRGG